MVSRRRRNVCDEEQARMPEGSEFQTEGAVMLKLWGSEGGVDSMN